MDASDKTMIRRQMLRMRNDLPAHFTEQTARITGGFIASLSAFQQAENVMLYCDYRNETGTGPLRSYCFRTGKQIALPLTDAHFEITAYSVQNSGQLQLSALGIQEPDPQQCAVLDPKKIDLVIVPGVAFDVFGCRIGYGKGCYDRFLPQLRDDAAVIGLAYDFQVLPGLPSSPADVRMDAIITEKGLLPVRGARHDVS